MVRKPRSISLSLTLINQVSFATKVSNFRLLAKNAKVAKGSNKLTRSLMAL